MIDIQGVTKHFDDVHALSKIDFRINKGEIVTMDNGAEKCRTSHGIRED